MERKKKSDRSTQKCIIKGEIVVSECEGQSGPGKSAFVQIYSRSEIDPSTGKGKLSKKAYLKAGKKSKDGTKLLRTYKIKLHVGSEFGIPGALLVTNRHKRKFFLKSATIEIVGNPQTIHFDCRSWVYPFKNTKSARLFFSNTSYLPDQTPSGLVELRKSELASLKGSGRDERNEWDRIYDYDYYNDLGHADNTLEQNNYATQVLGGSPSHPYPRRGRTIPSGRNTAGLRLDMYVPPDERFSPSKLSEFKSNSVKAIVHLLNSAGKSLVKHESNGFDSLYEINDLFCGERSNQAIEGQVAAELKKLVPGDIFKEIILASKKERMKFRLPQIAKENESAWMSDEEFGHQMVAGINPARLQRLEKFPPEGKNGVSTIQASHIEHNLDGLSLSMAMEQWRVFILDHHDYLMPFLERINELSVCAYASRTLLFLRNDATLKPVAIELTLPDPYDNTAEMSWVFVPATQGTEAAIWQLAKAHVAANDFAYHQLVTHWLHTHAVVEPFIIATRRQLSVMHPIHRLLDPHFKDTMHMNALARRFLINSGGILEYILFTQKISMELSSRLYQDWRFDEQALPADLLKRGLAIEDPESPTGVQVLFQDYPYGSDGLDVWCAIKTWVTDFCSVFYKDDDSVKSDTEIQEWWSEVRNVGHGDKCNEIWWYKMRSLSDLIQALTTLIWIASALHASVNFGQYAYAAYPLNRPTLCRNFVPMEGTNEFADFLRDPDKYYLDMLPQRFEMALGIALMEVLSSHTSDEIYLGQRPLNWTDNNQVAQNFQKFTNNLQAIEHKIFKRNANPNYKNRWGPAKIPYKLLHPDTSNVQSKGGITGKGIPNSISI